MRVEVHELSPADWLDVRRIFVEGIATGDATFETEAPSWESWDATHLPRPRLVAREAGAVVGWAALTPISSRRVYAGVAEVSLYVASGSRGRGVGRALLEALIKGAEAAGLWTLQAGIFPENAASVTLHEKCGFRVVGRRERLGKQGDRWRDVLLLERRAKTT